MRYLFFVMLLLSAYVPADSNVERISQSMERANLGAKVDFIEPSAMPGLYVVGLKGGRVLYASEDGNFFIQGRLYKAEKGRTVNLTDKQEREGIASAISDIDESKMIIFRAKKEDSVITVFTDTSCPFCHKLHAEIDELNDNGVTVRYLAYPRQGLKSDAYKTMVSVWCSEDPRTAISRAINDSSVTETSCDDPVKSHYLLGQQIGLQGTPTIVFENGTLVSGYRSAETIEKMTEAVSKHSE